MSSETIELCEYVTVVIDGQSFGVPVLLVQDVLREQPLTHIPLAPPEIAGSLNLRGRVVTAIDLRTRLGVERRADDLPSMNVVVEQDGELYSLIVDAVGDVLALTIETYEPSPATLDPLWLDLTDGLHRLDDDLMLILDIRQVLGEEVAEAA
tara:strand:+ start:66066 stop:66521 length:456 start_codon:yes stop_codon:yes gene_type:complete